MLDRSVTALLKLAGALVALKYLADLARDGQIALAIVAVMIPISIVILVRARGPAKTTAPLVRPIGEHGPAVFRQLAKPDQVRIASLAASGNAI